jgi:hypothetical protein
LGLPNNSAAQQDQPELKRVAVSVRSRVVERGLLEFPSSTTFVILSKGFLVWLSALDRSFVSQITLLGASNLEAFKTSMLAQGYSWSLLFAALNHVGLSWIIFSDASNPCSECASDMILISGSVAFIQHHARVSPNRILAVSTNHVRSKITKHFDTFWWFHLRHSTFGGSTTFQALVGTNVKNFEPERTAIWRNVGHVLDHSNRPRPASGPDAPGILASCLLPVSSLDSDIIYQTSFTATGWGRRKLSEDELGIAFGFPLWLRLARPSSHIFPLIPVQILLGCLRSILALSPKTSVLPIGSLGPSVGTPTCTWLPSIQKYLSHEWVDSSLATDKVVKHDDADFPSHLWCFLTSVRRSRFCENISPIVLPTISLESCVLSWFANMGWTGWHGYFVFAPLKFTNGPRLPWSIQGGSQMIYLSGMVN